MTGPEPLPLPYPDGVLTILESLADSYFETDLAGIFTYVNPAFCQAVGRPQEEIIGSSYRLFTAPAFIREVDRIFSRVLKTGTACPGFEFQFHWPDGGLGVAASSLSLKHDKAGQPHGFLGILRDITARQRADAALQHAVQAAERELEIGREIQSSFLPGDLPSLPGWELAASLEPAREVAGDFYDVFPLSGGKRLALVVGDVTDKGVGAALFMALFRSLIRAYADQHYALGWMDILAADREGEPEGSGVDRRRALLSTGSTALSTAVTLTNNYIATTHEQSSMFATIFFGVLDPATGALAYINGGHEPPIVIGPDGVQARLAPTGPAVGMLPDLAFRIERTRLAPEDILLAYTDGVTDARSPAGDFFTEEALVALAGTAPPSAQGLLDRIRDQLLAHIGDRALFDDITLLALRRQPDSEEPDIL